MKLDLSPKRTYIDCSGESFIAHDSNKQNIKAGSEQSQYGTLDGR